MDPTNVGFLKWLDPYEKKEKHVRNNIRDENRIFMSKLKNSIGESDLKNLIEKNELYTKEEEPEIFIEYPEKAPKIHIKMPHLTDDYKWKWANEKTWHEVDTLDVSKDGKFVAYTKSSSNYKKNYRLSVRGGASWTYNMYGGPNVAIVGSRVFFIEGDEPLHYTRLVSLDLETGGDRRVVYEELNRGVEIELVRCESRTLFLRSYDSGVEKLYHIKENGFTQLSPKGVSFYPVGGGKNPIYFVREGSFSAPWKLVGAAWKLNLRIGADGIEFCSETAGILITKFYGVRTIWKIGPTSPQKIYSGIFEVLPQIKGWLNGTCDEIHCIRPGSSVYTINLKNLAMNSPKITYGSTLECGISISSDKLPVRWSIIKPATKPIGLVCISYGAYGLPTSLNTVRWRIWIDAGWAIAFLFIRGGGDGNDMWADLGRLEGKKREFDDVEVCIRDLQRLTGCKANSTVLFGRSAGGLIVGNIAARWPLGNLVGIIYTEVPYVDLLKTAANPKLPLTEYEYKEFGNPRAGLADFESALEISPIHQLESQGAPGIKVLCRSGVHDLQVYPYESLKWIEALRGNRKSGDKILYIDNDSHHSKSVFKEHAEDFAIIMRWASQ